MLAYSGINVTFYLYKLILWNCCWIISKRAEYVAANWCKFL